MKNKKKGKIIIPAGRKPWAHEFHVAEVLAMNGHKVEFLLEGDVKTPDILLDGVEYEIKSPESMKAISIERTIKKALKQSPNLIIDISRIKKVNEKKICNFLIKQVRIRKSIKKMLLVTKQEKVIDVKKML